MKLLVTGANGQLGKALREIAGNYPGLDFTFLSREDLAIHHFELVRNFFRAIQPDICINCAAYTAVDKAEIEPELAFQVNAEAVGVLAAVCGAHGTKFMHVSTDYVFSGSASTPYREDDGTDPQSVYGASKREGERQAMHYNPSSVIIRTSWLYHHEGKNFVKTMLRLMGEKPFVGVVDDQWGSPTYAVDLAECILDMATSGIHEPGIYHFSNDGDINWHQFAVAIAQILKSPCEVRAIPTTSYPTPAKRPMYSVMDKSKISRVYGIRLKPWRERLEVCIEKMTSTA